MELKQLLEEGTEISVQFEKRGGYVPVVVQDAKSRKILMLAYANREALEITKKTGYATFWKTSENRIWTKGESSQNKLIIKDILLDCDQDAILYLVEMEKRGACHTENKDGEARTSCFYRRVSGDKLEFI